MKYEVRSIQLPDSTTKQQQGLFISIVLGNLHKICSHSLLTKQKVNGSFQENERGIDRLTSNSI